MDATVVVTGNRIYPTKLKSLSGLLATYDTKEIDDQSMWLNISFVNDMVSLQFL